MRYNLKSASTILLTFLFFSLHAFAQKVVRYEGTNQSLTERWSWAQNEVSQRGFTSGYWIGYSIKKLMPERSFIGSWYSNPRRNHPSLEEIITGVSREESSEPYSSKGTHFSGTMNFDDNKENAIKIMKDVAIVFHVDKTKLLEEITVSNMSLHVDLDNDPLIWLDEAKDGESIAFLKKMFSEPKMSNDNKEKIVTAIGLHQSPELVIPFLREVLNGKEHSDVREESAFWLGQQQSDEVLNILLNAAEHDKSENVREKAVFAISEMENDKGLESLIALAKKGTDTDVRTKAMFWLGQKASEKSFETLNDIAYNDEDTEVQKQAVFALTQLSDDQSVDVLIKIAKTHQNPEVRKQAIFWLGESESPRALQALIDIVKK